MRMSRVSFLIEGVCLPTVSLFGLIGKIRIIVAFPKVHIKIASTKMAKKIKVTARTRE